LPTQCTHTRTSTANTRRKSHAATRERMPRRSRCLSLLPLFLLQHVAEELCLCRVVRHVAPLILLRVTRHDLRPKRRVRGEHPRVPRQMKSRRRLCLMARTNARASASPLHEPPPLPVDRERERMKPELSFAVADSHPIKSQRVQVHVQPQRAVTSLHKSHKSRVRRTHARKTEVPLGALPQLRRQ
jgi:hypothetical protein